MQQQKWEFHHRLQLYKTRKFLHHRVYQKDAQYAKGALGGNAIRAKSQCAHSIL